MSLMNVQTTTSRLAAVRELLTAGRPDRVLEVGRQLSGELTDPSDLATLHLLMGHAELSNGRFTPALQRFRMADFEFLSTRDRLGLTIAEAFTRYGSGGLTAVIEVIDEIEANANGDDLMIAAGAGLRAWTSLEQNNAARGVELALLANETSHRHGDDDFIVLSTVILSLAYATSGNIDQAGRTAAKGIEHATSSGHTLSLPMLHMVAADVDHCRGRIAHAQHHARLAIESSEPISAGVVGVWGHAVLATLADRVGDADAAAGQVLDAERALLRGAPMGWGNLAVARLRVDRQSNPQQAAQRLLDVWRFIDDQNTSGHPTMFALPVTELIGRLTDQPTIQEFTQRLKKLNPPNPMDHMIRDLACAIIEGDSTSAIALVEALNGARSTYTAPLGDAMSLVADLLLRMGDRRARSFADAAREIYEQIGAHGDLRRLVSRHPGISKEQDLVLTAAERRVVSLVVDGCTNAEIAEQLFLSVKTVETHLARVYRRFGVKSRTQLVSSLRLNES
jgi:ATP/maltotriose-dependent transcriptional regulator MalT